MRKEVIASLFGDREQAERIVHELCDAGVPGEAISIVALHEDAHKKSDEHVVSKDNGDGAGTGVTKGVLAGGAVGAIAGLAALLIPGVGPFIAGGAIAQALGTAGSAIAVSGAVGAAAGGLATSLVDYGVDKNHAEYAERRVREGAALVTVDTSSDPSAYRPTRAILSAGGGEMLHERQTESA